MFYAIHFDGSGNAVSRLEYSDEQPVLPSGQVACTREQHDDHTSYKLDGGEIVMHGAATLLAMARADQIAAIRAACIDEFAKLPAVCMPGEWATRGDEILAKRIDLTERVNAAADADAVRAVVW
jgi:hypothetical protein